MTDSNQVTAEPTVEDVTLSSEETEVENTEAETTVESTEDSDTPSEGDNTSEVESEDDAVEKLSPRYERDNKRLNAMLESKNQEIEALKTGNVPAPVAPAPGIPASPSVESYKIDMLTKRIEASEAREKKEAADKWYMEDQKNFDKVVSEFPELKKDTELLAMIKDRARSIAVSEGEGKYANYSKVARALNKKFKFAKDQGREEAAERETVVGHTASPSAKKREGAVAPRKFDEIRKTVSRKERLNTGDIADLIGAARTS